MREDILRLRKEKGLSYAKISKELGCSLGVVRYYLEPNRKRNQFKRAERRRQHSSIIKKELGGRCSICSYDKCLAALHFHHTDPKQKSFTIGKHKARRIAWLREEAAKCILVCANCHAEIESNKFKARQLTPTGFQVDEQST